MPIVHGAIFLPSVLKNKALQRFVEPQTNRRAEASKNKSVQQRSTLRGSANNFKTIY